MSQGVFTENLRVEFIEKMSSDVGTGTAFPMLITGASAQVKFDKLAELLARVRRAKFSGGITCEFSFATYSLQFTTAAPPANNYTGTTSDCVIQQAYADTATPPVNVTQESRIWRGPLKTPDAPVSGSLRDGIWTASHGLVTGFTHYAESYEVASGYYPYGLQGSTEFRAAVELSFSGQVAWVNTNLSGDILDPLNELYVGMNFYAFSWDLKRLDAGTDGPAMLDVDAYSEAIGNPDEGEAGNLTFALHTGNLTCPIWLAREEKLTSYSMDITITPTEWWPYAKNSPATPVWNTSTGAKL